MKKIIKMLIVIICMVFLMSLITSINCFAQSTATTKHQTIRVACPEQEGLFEIDQNGNYSGYSYEYLKKIAEITGWNYEFITFPNKTEEEALQMSLDMVKNGEADLIGVMEKSNQLSEEYEYPQNNYGLEYTILSVVENNYNIDETSFTTFNPLCIAVDKNDTEQISEMEKFLNSSDTKYKIISCNNEQEQYNLLNSGVANAILGISIEYHYDTRIVANFSPKPIYFVTTKGNTQITKQLDEAIEFIESTLPFFQSQLYLKYFDDTSNDFVLTENEQEFFAKKKVIKALLIPNSAPFAFVSPQGKPCGVLVSVLEEFAEKSGLSVEYEIYDKSKKFSDVLENGDYDCILGIPVNSDYNSDLGIITSESLTTVEIVSFSKNNTLNKPLSDCKVALVRASSIANQIESKDIIYFDDIEQCIKAVNSGKADIGFGNKSTVNYYIYDNFANLITTPWVGNDQNIEISVLKSSGSTFISLLNKYIRSIKESDLTYFYSQANSIEYKNSIELFARSNPLLAVIFFSILCITVCISIILVIVSAKIKKKNLALQRATSAKSEFLSNMSHDMRTPMNAIIGFSDFALENNCDLKSMKEYMQEINFSSKYLLSLINDVLEMSKMENTTITLHYEPVDGYEIIKQIKNIVEPSMKKKNIEFDLSIAKFVQQSYIITDKMRMEQILINILSNAVKFTPENGKVEMFCRNLHLTETKVTGEIVVKDNGIGMSKEFIPKLFLPFEQENRNEIQNSMGTGLGMSIVKNIIELMGGKISVKSEINVGTEIAIFLQAKLITKLEKDMTTSDITNDVKSLEGKRILIAEDHPVNLKIAIKLLENLGCKVECAENGKLVTEKFEASSNNYFDAILMDIRMPVINGLEATKIIRSFNRPDAKTIPIIAMTANAFAEDIEKSIDYGMTAYLAKPINSKLVCETLIKEIYK